MEEIYTSCLQYLCIKSAKVLKSILVYLFMPEMITNLFILIIQTNVIQPEPGNYRENKLS